MYVILSKNNVNYFYGKTLFERAWGTYQFTYFKKVCNRDVIVVNGRSYKNNVIICQIVKFAMELILQRNM